MKATRYISRFLLVFILIFSWVFSGWPQFSNFPPKIQEARAAVSTVYASSYSVDGTLEEWTNQTYVYSDDGINFATRAGTAKNTWYGDLFGFDLSGIPDNSTINSVTITAEWKNSAADTAGPVLYVGAKSGGAEVGTSTSDTTGQTTFELVTNSPTGLTAANLKATGASGFWAILKFRRTDNTAYVASVDYVKVAVDYTPPVAPTVTTQAATLKEATTATCNGTITATGGVNSTNAGCEWDIDTGAPYVNTASTAGDYGAASFTQALTGLPSGTTIYARAFATNSAGTGYGGEVNWLTKPAAPTALNFT
ncbi:MAG: hypothetical protein Q8L21_00680, partial [Candidatus Komeilibacteria bacterium]|nr:hypothetical protein [Candidatus Komeilibacteria bacterium]